MQRSEQDRYLDTHGPALKAATEARPYLVRLNHLEAQELLGGDEHEQGVDDATGQSTGHGTTLRGFFGHDVAIWPGQR